MGAEAKCTIAIEGRLVEGTALLETDDLRVRSKDVKRAIPLSAITDLRVDGGVLEVAWDGERARFDLGEKTAAKWAEKIRAPRSPLEKLGLKKEARVGVVRFEGDPMLEEMRARVASIADAKNGRGPFDAILVRVTEVKHLDELDRLLEKLDDGGAIWILREKGKGAPVSESAAREACRARGLVDVKVVRYSERETADKYLRRKSP